MGFVSKIIKPLVSPDMRRVVRTRQRAILHQLSNSIFTMRSLVGGSIGLLPDFLIIGAQKCGTTSLYNYLIQSPCIYKSFVKEVGYFDRYYNCKNIKWYRSHFPSFIRRSIIKNILKKEFVTGEASTGYILNPHSLRRIFEVTPEAKLILMLRNPIDRAYSHYHYTSSMGLETLSLEEAIKAEKKRIGEAWNRTMMDETYYNFDIALYAYISTGIYADQVKVLLSLFPRDQIMFIKSEDFFKDTVGTVKQALEFLNLPSWELKSTKIYLKGKKSRMNGNLRKKLCDFYRPHNFRLYELIGMDFGWES
ncbi:MAG: sulfotransferase domain-containing protein [Candidatus Kuenenia sp.]|nr:sulfotransferase domain-containing protein [Candidatus Kuenenia hertensis]